MTDIDIAGFVGRAAERSGFVREAYVEASLPTSLARMTVMPFFGDHRSQYVLSVFLLHRFIAEFRRDRYFILAGPPGLAGLFPYVDEYWGVSDAGSAAELAAAARGFGNESDKAVAAVRGLNQYFADVVEYEGHFKRFYDAGLGKDFFDTFGRVTVALPPLRSLGIEQSRSFSQRPGYKVFLSPATAGVDWGHGQHSRHRVPREFWVDVCTALLRSNITPVVWQPAGTHDLSTDLHGRCLFLTDTDVLDVLAAMRACGCVLDVFGGLSRYANFARCPFLAVTTRTRFTGLKEYELDDLSVLNKAYRYIFSHPTILEGGRWESLVDGVVGHLLEALPRVNRDTWPPTSEYVAAVSYESVRRRKTKRIGSRFIRVPRV